MENSTLYCRRHQTAAGTGGSPPRLTRSKSGGILTPTTSLPHYYNHTAASDHRSKSTAKSRNRSDRQQNMMIYGSTKSPGTQKKSVPHQDIINKDGNTTFVRFLQRSTQRTSNNIQKISPRLKPTSPSAWALSPARPSPFSPCPVPKSPSTTTSAVSGVLKYFRPKKKVKLIQELEYRQLCLLQNNLLQWRFGNARAEAAMAAVKIIAEKKLFKVWLRILVMRDCILEKRIQMQRMKHGIKVYQITEPEDRLLREWAKMESKNCEAVGRVIRKLSATSVRLPLADDAKGDILSLKDAMNTATVVMDSVEATVRKFDYQVERTCYLLTELVVIVKQQKEYLEELEKNVALISLLKAEQKSLSAHLIQLREESKRVGG